jgi:hypothetical protein
MGTAPYPSMNVDNAAQRLIGRPVWDLLPYMIAHNPDIAELRLQAYKPAPKLSERLVGQLSCADEELLRKADEVRKPTGIPFWDALLAIAMREGKLDSKIAQSALLHDDQQKPTTFVLKAEEIRADRIRDIASTVTPGYGLVICSRVKMLDGQSLHIPMIDLRCPVSSSLHSGIRALLDKTEQVTGVLVESGKSYHLYATSLLPHEKWIRFMAVSLLLSPLTDPRYIAHRLADGECRLKISSEKNIVPVIAHIL